MKKKTVERLIRSNRGVSRTDLDVVRDMLRELHAMGVIKNRSLSDAIYQPRRTLVPDDAEPVLLNSRS